MLSSALQEPCFFRKRIYDLAIHPWRLKVIGLSLSPFITFSTYRLTHSSLEVIRRFQFRTSTNRCLAALNRRSMIIRRLIRVRNQWVLVQTELSVSFLRHTQITSRGGVEMRRLVVFLPIVLSFILLEDLLHIFSILVHGEGSEFR